MWRFERLCGRLGLRIERRKLMAFRGSLPVRTISSAMKRLPGLREFFTANAIYTLALR